MFKGAVLRYLLSDALSLIGNSIAGVVLPLVLLARTGDVLAAGSLALICAVPQFVCGVVGGAVLDRVNRRTVSVVADLISAASCALLPVVDEVWGLSFGWFVVLGLLGAVIAFFLQWALYAAVARGVDSNDTLQLIQVMPFSELWAPVAAVFALAGIVIGVGGSLSAIRKFLQV